MKSTSVINEAIPASSPKRSMAILVIDDDPEIRLLLQTAIEWKGYKAVLAENGAEGLAGSKRVIVAISRGGFYGAGSPVAALEHLESYLRGVFGFIGVSELEFISADGVQAGPEHREKALANALEAATNLRAA